LFGGGWGSGWKTTKKTKKPPKKNKTTKKQTKKKKKKPKQQKKTQKKTKKQKKQNNKTKNKTHNQTNTAGQPAPDRLEPNRWRFFTVFLVLALAPMALPAAERPGLRLRPSLLVAVKYGFFSGSLVDVFTSCFFLLPHFCWAILPSSGPWTLVRAAFSFFFPCDCAHHCLSCDHSARLHRLRTDLPFSCFFFRRTCYTQGLILCDSPLFDYETLRVSTRRDFSPSFHRQLELRGTILLPDPNCSRSNLFHFLHVPLFLEAFASISFHASSFPDDPIPFELPVSLVKCASARTCFPLLGSP